jgi:hypothetical protein
VDQGAGAAEALEAEKFVAQIRANATKSAPHRTKKLSPVSHLQDTWPKRIRPHPGPGYTARMIPPGPTLPELWRMAAQHHGALRRFAVREAAGWADPAIRRTARRGLALLTAMIRRLLHLLALDVLLPPLRPRSDLAAIAPLTPPRARRHRFRLTETPRERAPRYANPDPAPDTPELSHALFLERLAVLAAAWRARDRIARRLARRVQPASAKPSLRPLPPALRARALPGLIAVHDYVEECLAARARAPP